MPVIDHATRTRNGLQSQCSVKREYVDKSIRTPQIGEALFTRQEAANPHDRRAVALLKNQTVMGHMPREFFRIFWRFLNHGDSISCKVTGKRKYGKGLEIPCVHEFLSSKKKKEYEMCIDVLPCLPNPLSEGNPSCTCIDLSLHVVI